MNSTVIIFRHLKQSIGKPLIFIAAVGFLQYVVSPEDNSALLLLCAIGIPLYYLHSVIKISTPALFGALLIPCASIMLYSTTGQYLSLFSILFVTIIYGITLKKQGFVFGVIIPAGILVLTVLFFTLFQHSLQSFLTSVCMRLQNKGTLYGVIEEIYAFIFDRQLEQCMLYTDASESIIQNYEVISGVRNIFITGDNSHLIAEYMTGKYFVNFFVIGGLLTSVLFKNNEQRWVLLSLYLLSVFSGEHRLAALYLVIYQPLLYLVLLFGVGISYFLAALLQLSVGYRDNASLIEFVKYVQHPLLFIISGLVLFLMVFYLSRMVLMRFDFQAETYLPKPVRFILDSLGGRTNIRTVYKDRLEVYNPNLINLLNLDCEIRQNVILLPLEDIQLLKDYW